MATEPHSVSQVGRAGSEKTDAHLADELAKQTDESHFSKVTPPSLSQKKKINYQILGQRPEGPQYTSQKRAYELVERGIAVFEGLKSIRLLPEPVVRVMRRFEQQLAIEKMTAAEIDRQLNENRQGVVFWNGNTGSEMRFRPGEVIS